MRAHALFLALGLAPLPAAAAGVTEIQAANGVQFAEIREISGDGEVLVGDCRIGTNGAGPCRWSAADGYRLLAPLEAGAWTQVTATSENGSVSVGWSAAADALVPVRWNAEGEVERFAGDLEGVAFDVSADGSLIVGSTPVPSAQTNRPFRWSASGGLVVAEVGEEAVGVSADGTRAAACCVLSTQGFQPRVPFAWDADGKVTPLPKVHAFGDESYGISPDGLTILAGLSMLHDHPGHAWRWTKKRGREVVARAYAGQWDAYRPHDASFDAAVIVGYESSWSGHSFVWDAVNGARPLRAAIAAAGVDVSAWESFQDTRGVSWDGTRMPAMGRRIDGSAVAVLVVLDPPPASASESSIPVAVALALLPLALLGRRGAALLVVVLAVPQAAGAAGLVAIEPRDGVALETLVSLSGDGRTINGTCRQGSANPRLCRWPVDGPVQWLQSPPSGSYGYVNDTSDDGSISVGSVRTGNGPERAAIWKADGTLEELVPPGGVTETTALSVSSDGRVVKGIARTGPPQIAFRWMRETGMQLVPTPAAIWLEGFASDADVAHGSFRSLPGGAALWRFGEAPIHVESPTAWVFDSYLLSADGSAVFGLENVYPADSALRWTEAGGSVSLGPVEDPFFLTPVVYAASEDGTTAGGFDEIEGAWLWRAELGVMRVTDYLRTRHGVDVHAWDLWAIHDLSDDGRTALASGSRGGASFTVLAKLGPACSDGLDNDGDGAVDMTDPQCMSPDGLVEHRSCGLGFEIVFVIAPFAFARARRRATRTRP